MRVIPLAIGSLLLYLNNRDEDWYKNLPTYVKETTWPVKVGDIVYKFPKPFEVGMLFGTGTEKIAETMIEKDPDVFNEFLLTMADEFVPSILPTVAVPIVEVYSNKKTFQNTPLVPAYLEGLLAPEQFHPYTTELSKALGAAISELPGLDDSFLASPIVLENFVTGWGGGLGRMALRLVDKAGRELGILPNDEKIPENLSDNPFIRAYQVRQPSMGTY